MLLIKSQALILGFLSPPNEVMSPPNDVSEGTMKRGSVCVCVRPYVCPSGLKNQWKMLLLWHFLANFDSVCFIW